MNNILHEMKIELHIFTNCTHYIDNDKTIVDTYSSFNETFGELNLTIWLDLNPNKSMLNTYFRYLKNTFPDAIVNITNSLSDGYIRMINSTTADYIFALEHDWVFNKENIKHSLNDICNEMNIHNISHVRFNKNHNWISEGKAWPDMNAHEYNDMFCKTNSASNNPHIINVNEYKNTALKYIKLEKGPWGIEDNLRNKDDCNFMVYGDKTTPATLTHIDASHNYPEQRLRNRKERIKHLYKVVLDREADEVGLDNYTQSGLTLYDIQLEMWNSEEFKNKFKFNAYEPSELYNEVPIYVINLERRPDRKEEIKTKLDNLGIKNYEFVNAIDGKQLTEDDLSTHYNNVRAKDIHREMKKTEVACALSHIECAKNIVANNLDYAIVLEDDAELTYEFKQFLKDFKLNSNYDFDFLILGAFSSNHFFNGKVKTKKSPYTLIEKESIIYLDSIKYNIGNVSIHNSYYPTKQLDYVHGMHAYMMSNIGARKLLEMNYPVIVEADNMWNYFPEFWKVEFTNPILCHRQHLDSDIRNERNAIATDDKNFSAHFLRRKNHVDFGT